MAADLEPARIPALFGIILLGTAMFGGLGYLIGGRIDSPDAATNLCTIVQLVTLFLSGLAIPFAMLPDGVVKVLSLLPTTFFADLMLTQMPGATTQHPAWLSAAVVSGCAVAAIGAAIAWFKWDQGEGGNRVTGEKDARESLDQAAYLAQRMRAQGRWHRPLIALLGLAMFAAVLVSGMALPPPLQTAGFTLAVLLLMGLVIYTASRKVIPRHHKLLYSLVTPLGVLLYTLTVVLGQVFFPKVLWWWLTGSILSTLPFWIIIAVNAATGRRR